MGGFFLVRRDDRQNAALSRMEASFQQQGFDAPERLQTGWGTLCVYRKSGAGSEPVHRGDGADFCTGVGTFLYKETRGRIALSRILDDLKAGRLDPRRLFGHFCIIAQHDGRLTLFTDPIGTYPVWRDDGARVFTSSFLAAVAAVDRPRVDVQAAYEYVFQGSTYGGDTLIEQISLMDCRSRHIFEPELRLEAIPVDTPAAPEDAPIEVHVERNVANLRRYYDAIARGFGGAIDTALSGGYDSRLTLALLMERGRTPNIHVYGRPDDPDVRVARAIARGEGIALSHVDKSMRPRPDPEAFPALMERNFHAFHGHPVDGMFENGTDLATRLDRGRGGTLMLNGGGGEIFRNFFYLPDRRFSARELIWSFYSRFDPRACSAAFDEDAYSARLERKLRRTLGVADGPLDRMAVERAYPEFRCRFWMGKNNSVNNQFGFALTPFVDANIVPDALRVPLSQKDHGRLEARMIKAINPRLAAYESAYGHPLDGEPPLSRRFRDRTTYMRPPWVRRYTFRLKTRPPRTLPFYLEPPYLGRTIDLEFPYGRRLFDIESVHDAGQYNRLATLEYLCQRIGAVLETEHFAEAA